MKRTLTKQFVTVVTNVNHITGLNTARSLSEAGCTVIGLSSDKSSPLNFTNKCKELYFHTNSKDLVQALLLIASKFEQPIVLIPCSDLHVISISDNRTILQKDFIFSLPEIDIVNTLMDKSKFAIHAKEKGYNIPQTFTLTKERPLTEQAKELTFPCVLKPIYKDMQWNKFNPTNKTFRIHNRKELSRICEIIFKYMNQCIVQEWIYGPDENIYFCLLCYNSDGKYLTSWTGKKIRQWPPHVGSTSSAEPANNELVTQESIRIFNNINYKGLGSVEFKYCTKRKKLFITEPTVGRPNLQSRIATLNGVNLPALLVANMNIGFNYSASSEPPCKWIHEWAELYSFSYYRKKHDLKFSKWLISLSGKKGFAIFSIKDIKPFIFTFLQKIKIKAIRFSKYLTNFFKPS